MGGRGRWGGSKKGEGTWEREEELLGWRFDEDPGGGKAGVLGLLWERDVWCWDPAVLGVLWIEEARLFKDLWYSTLGTAGFR